MAGPLGAHRTCLHGLLALARARQRAMGREGGWWLADGLMVIWPSWGPLSDQRLGVVVSHSVKGFKGKNRSSGLRGEVWLPLRPALSCACNFC